MNVVTFHKAGHTAAGAAAIALLLSTSASLAVDPSSNFPAANRQAAEPAQATSPPALGDADAGRKIALNVCWACHVVAPDQEFKPFLNPPAPAFSAIANKRGTTAESLQHFITTTHKGIVAQHQMPNPELTDEQVADVASFIMTLRNHR